jgi:EmrB/QacA subfamily drug resistance transporter
MLKSSQQTTDSPRAGAGALPPELRRLAMAIMLGAFMVALDMTIVNVALHTLVRDFHTSVATIQWVSTSYLLAVAMVIPVTGWAIARFGARSSWIAALLLFIGGSVLCGIAWSPGSLIAFRILQGSGGGMLLPLAQTILAQAAGPERLGRVMAAVGVPAMLGPVLGPVLGGLIVTDSTWRLMFYINVPVCIAAIVAAYRVAMPTSRSAGREARLDVVGLALLSPGLAAVVYGLAQTASYGGFSNVHVLAPVIAGVLLLGVFAVHAVRDSEPLIDVRLFAKRSFGAPGALVLLFSMAMLGVQLLMPLYYQQARHESALAAGLLLAPSGLGMAVALVVSGRLSDRIAPRPIILTGLALSALSTLLYTQLDEHTSLLLLSGTLVLNGAGIGAALVPSLAAPYRGLAPTQIPKATSTIRILQQLGGALGVAILAVVLQGQLSDQAHHAGNVALAYGHVFWWALGFIALAAIPALLLPGSRSRGHALGQVESGERVRAPEEHDLRDRRFPQGQHRDRVSHVRARLLAPAVVAERDLTVRPSRQ